MLLLQVLYNANSQQDQAPATKSSTRITSEEDEGMTEQRRGVFAISVAAEMASMQVQNLRVYERRGLIEPDRTPGGTRLYSHRDVERLQRIGELLSQGLNLAGIAKVLTLEAEVRRLTQARSAARTAPAPPRNTPRPLGR